MAPEPWRPEKPTVAQDPIGPYKAMAAPGFQRALEALEAIVASGSSGSYRGLKSPQWPRIP